MQGVLLFEVGNAAVYLAVSGDYLSFLKAGMFLPLSAAGVILMALGTWTALPVALAYVNDDPAEGGPDAGVDGGRHDDGQREGGHDEGHDGPRAGWLLVLPLVALVLMARVPLGADAARREVLRSGPPPSDLTFPPLQPPTGGAVEMSVSTFVTRATYDREQGLAGEPVRMTGFVVSDPAAPEGYLLTRFSLMCCAADAYTSQVEVRGLPGRPPPDDTWVVVVGEWVPPSGGDGPVIDRPPVLQLQTQTVIDAPENPYD